MAGATSNRESIIQVSAKISSLRDTLNKTKEELKQAEAQLDRLLSADPSSLVASPVFAAAGMSAVAHIADLDKTLNQQLVDWLDAEPDRDFSTEHIIALAPDANTTSIRSALARLASEGKINRTKRGYYQSSKGTLVQPVLQESA